MAKQWYFVKDGQQHGPISSIELKRKADSGEIGPDAAVRPEDRQNWVKAAAVKGLCIAKAMPPSPPYVHVPTPSPRLSSPLASGGNEATTRPSGSAAAQSPAALRQKIEGLRQSILQHVLNHSSGLPDIEPIATFRKGHADQQERLTQLRSRIQELGRAKAEYEVLDNTCQQKAKELAAAEANLKQYARPLGKAAFEGAVLGQMQDQPVFRERSALQGRIGELHAEHDRLAPLADVGMVQKTKAKAQQLVVVGKIKFEETKIGKLEEQIGGQLIGSNQEDSVRCERTARVLAELAKHREVVAHHKRECDEARKALDQKKQQLATTLKMTDIEGGKSFNAERQNCEVQLSQIENQRNVQEAQLIERLLASEVQGTLGQLLYDLRDAQTRSKVTSQAASSRPSDGPQCYVRPFSEWYRTSWLSQKSGRVQIIVWAVLGFVWIPYWYFWTATPSGSLRGKWASLGRVRQVAFVALTCVLCLSLVMASQKERADFSPSGNRHPEVASDRNTNKTPAFSPADYSYDFSRDDQSIPVGAKQRTLENTLLDIGTPEGTDLRATVNAKTEVGKYAVESGYVTSDGKWVRHGQRTLWYDEKKTTKYLEEHWLHGRLHGESKTWHPNGMCHSEATVVNGRIHGMVQGWFLNGQMEVQSYAWHGEQHGICKSWFENGVLGKECVYVHDQRCGTYKEWWPTGKPAIVEEYSDDKLHGKQTRWDEKGRKTAEGEWNHGERVGVWTLGLERQGRPDEFYYVTVSMGPWTGGTREQFLVRIGFACRESVFSPREGIFSGLVDSDAFLFEVFGKPNKILPDPKSRNSHIWRYDNCSDGPVFLRSSWYAPKQLFQLWDYTPKSQPEPNPEP